MQWLMPSNGLSLFVIIVLCLAINDPFLYQQVRNSITHLTIVPMHYDAAIKEKEHYKSRFTSLATVESEAKLLKSNLLDSKLDKFPVNTPKQSLNYFKI